MIKQFTKLLCGLVLLIISGATKAQVSAYTFAASSGTYTDITGGTPVATSTSVADFLGDTKTSVNIPLGFSFVFNGITYTQVKAMSDGFLSFNTSATSLATNNLSTSGAASRPLVAPLWDDLAGSATLGSASNYLTTGTAGSRVFTIEWKNWLWRYNATAAGISFQVNLYEGTNKIEFIYRQEAGALSTPTASIGIAGVGTGSGNFLSLNNSSAAPTVSSTTETTSISTKPATGQIYAFTPPPPPAIDMQLISINIPEVICPSSAYPVSVVVKNNGTDPINFSTTNATINLVITGLSPQILMATVNAGTLASGATQSVTLTPNANLSGSGRDTLTATVTVTSDGNASNNSSISTTFVTTVTTSPWSEGFTTTAVPTGWQTTGWTIGSTRGVTGNPGNNIYKNLYSLVTAGTFTTLQVGPVVSTNELKFDYKISNYSSPYAAPADGWGNFKVQISSDCGTTFNDLETVTTSSATWITKTYPLSAYAGQNVIIKILATWTAGDWDLGFDNFKIETPAACPSPTSTNISLITSNSASVNFTSTGTSFVIEYGATGFIPGTGATAGTGGTIVTGAASPVALTGLTPNTTYQVYVRQNCSGAGNGYSTNSTVVSFTTTPACTTNISPADRATNVTIPFTLTWNAAPGATSYDVYFGADPAALPNIGNVTGTSTGVTNTTYNTTYYWYIAPRNAGGANTGCQSATTRFITAAPPPPPPNDACTNATSLVVSNGFCLNPIAGTLAGADSTTGLGTQSCATSGEKYDVWYKLSVPATGKVTVRTHAIRTVGGNDLVVSAYTGACGSLTAVTSGCNDDGNPDVGANAAHSWLGLTGQTPASTIYIRVTAYDLISLDSFSICAYDTTASVLPPIASGSVNACVPGNTVTITQSSANNYVWVPLLDASGNIIAELNANGNNLGAITSSYYKNTGAVRSANAFYLDRNFTITPANQPVLNSTNNRPSIRFYFTTSELTAFAATAGATTRAQLMVTKNNDPCSGIYTENGKYALGAINASSAYSSDNYIEDSVSSFSSFFIHRTGTILPITLEYLKGLKAGTGNALNWKVNCTSVSITMELERSSDSRSFKSITSITAPQARCGQPFDYVDAAPLKGTNYYRLKMIDVDGKVTYSPIVAIINGGSGAELVGIYPTVVRDEAFLSVAASRSTKMQIRISDMSGKVIRTISQMVANGSSLININTATLSTGVYNITGLLDGVQTKTLRFVKQ